MGIVRKKNATFLLLQSTDEEVRFASENQLIIDLSHVNIHEALARGRRF